MPRRAGGGGADGWAPPPQGAFGSTAGSRASKSADASGLQGFLRDAVGPARQRTPSPLEGGVVLRMCMRAPRCVGIWFTYKDT